MGTVVPITFTSVTGKKSLKEFFEIMNAAQAIRPPAREEA